jgi:glucose/arabinose dehydrogenase
VRVRSKGFAVMAGAATVAVALLTGAIANAASTNVSAAADVLLSRNKPVVASSTGGCCPAKNAVDGNSATRWASAANIDPSWIYVDLQATAHISRVRLQWDASCATAYRVESSADHTTWTTLSSTSTGDGGVDDLTVNGTGRYVRMFGTHRCRTDATKGYSLQEFDVFGSTGTGNKPPTPPGTPTLVSSTSSSVTIKWGASTDDSGSIASYHIFRDGQDCATVPGNTLQGTCTGLNGNQAYGFYVQAFDGAGLNSDSSDTLSVTTPPSNDPNPPTAPTNLHRTALSATSVTLAWTAATDDVGVRGYRVYNAGNPTAMATATGTSVSINTLTPKTLYHFTVKAFDANQEGPASNTLDVTTPAGSCTVPVCPPTQIATDNDVVWGLVTLPDGTLLYNRRDAHDIAHLNPKTGAKKSIGTVPNVQSTNGEGGLTGLEINPVSFAADHWLYIMHTSPSDNRIVRIKYDPAADTLLTGTEQVLLTGIARNKFHNGGRLRFSPDGQFLFAGTGDAQNGSNAQNRSSLNGKVLRIRPDGSIPGDNPFGNAVWSYGHRNVQGLAFDSQGRLWEQEFGNSIMDETNLIVRGGNYGWPACEGTSGTCGTAGFIAPKHTYSTTSGSCSGITIVRDVLYVACQVGQRLYRETISGSSLTNVTSFFQGTFGRLRTVEPAPDGGLWLATSNGGDKDSTPNNSNNRIFHVDLGA